jgi:hypothetical protein
LTRRLPRRRFQNHAQSNDEKHGNAGILGVWEAVDKGFAKSGGSQDDFDFAAKTWVPIAEKCLVEGKTGWSS